ncbi:MAG: hypothetical protein WAM91_04275 [Candidatus Acidiferrales bacterium]
MVSTARNGSPAESLSASARGSAASTDAPAFTVVRDLGRASLLVLASLVALASPRAPESHRALVDSHAGDLSAALRLAVASAVVAVSAAEAVDTVVADTVAVTVNFPLR